MKVVTYITPQYEEEVKRLVKSCEDNNQKLIIDRVKCEGSWEKNTGQKAAVVFRHLCLNEPFIITDADSEIVKPIDESVFAGCDIAVRYKGGKEMLSSTMFFRPTKAVFALVANWAWRIPQEYHVFEQLHLQNAIKSLDFKVGVMPDRYCAIFDEKPHIEDPVIRHHQASRRLRHTIGKS